MNDSFRLAAAVRAACARAAREEYEDAGVRGLCLEGRVEAALSAIDRIDLTSVVDGLAEVTDRPGGAGRRRSSR